MKPSEYSESHLVSAPAIVVAAWRRPVALGRLLDSLNRADFPPQLQIHLIISLDGGASEPVRELAAAFRFAAGTCEVVHHGENLGVRRHILWCGDQSARFRSVIVLEEDLLVGRAFYRFALAGLQAYRGSDKVASVALYAPEFNEIARLPFVPADNGFDAYFMRFPCSSGQLWDAGSWQVFRSWLAIRFQAETNGYRGDFPSELPAYVAGWPDSSWKKWYAAWLVDTGRFVAYPYKSHTTNCSDPGGSHVSNQFQPDVQVNMFTPVPVVVPAHTSATDILSADAGPESAVSPMRSENASSAYLAGRVSEGLYGSDWHFPPAESSPDVAYDAYMEPCGELVRHAVARLTGESGFTVQADLHGCKPIRLMHQADWCITLRTSGNPRAYFPLTFRPVEANLDWPCEVSHGFFVLSRPHDLGRLSIRSRYIITRYFTRGSLFRVDFLSGYVLSILIKTVEQAGIFWGRFWRSRPSG